MNKIIIFIASVSVYACTGTAQVGTKSEVALSNIDHQVAVLGIGDATKTLQIESYSATGPRMISVQSQAEISVVIYDPSSAVVASGNLTQQANHVGPFGFIMPTSVGGFEWTTIIDNPVVGTYQVEVAHGSTIEESLAIVTSEATNDELGAAVVAVVDSRLGPVAGISMFVAQGEFPCTGGVASASVHDSAGNATTILLQDNGVGVDFAALDGVYSGGYDIVTSGEHFVSAQYVGIVPSGTPGVQLEATTRFTGSTAEPPLPDPPVLLHPLPWAVNYTLDDVDDNGFYEHMFLDIELDIINDTRGLSYTTEVVIDILESDLTPIYSPLVLSVTDGVVTGNNTIRVDIPMSIASQLGNAVKLELDSIEFTAGGASLLFDDLDVRSNYLDFDQFEHCPADVNLDWQVTPTDFAAWISAYNTGDLLADANGDGQVTPTDFTAWIAHYNSGC